MMQKSPHGRRGLRRALAQQLLTPVALAALPLLSVVGYLAMGELALFTVAGLLSLTCLVVGSSAGARAVMLPRDALSGLMPRDLFDDRVAQIHAATGAREQYAALFTLEIDDFAALRDHHGQAAADAVVKRCAERFTAVMRETDVTSRIGDGRFSGCVGPVRHLDLESCIQIAGRIQAEIEQPVVVGGTTIFVTVCIGFCQHARVSGDSGEDWIEAAAVALREAQLNGPASIRAFNHEMRRRARHHAALCDEVSLALDNGHIQPWFQPQISTDTGKVTGFEALARWQHPVQGLLAPKTFLAALEQAGLLERLTDVMLHHALTALKAWDAAGLDVPQVGVNFAGAELGNPRLVEKLRWELDRFELEPQRLAIEVLETVMASDPDDVVSRNLDGLCKLGCRIDLDDFGTGHASLAAIRRFSVSRIKIDRSFVMKSDRDPEQQKMISAILTMAERLGVQTLAEGVETAGEHAYLAQLGCDHVQGYGIARPMPFEHTMDWLVQHAAKLSSTPQIFGDRST